MTCFLCKTPLLVASLSVRTYQQPAATVDERGYANFCPDCAARLSDACDASSREMSAEYPSLVESQEQQNG